MDDLIFDFTSDIAIDMAFDFDHVVLVDAFVSIEGNTATYDVSATGGSVIVDVFAAVTDGSSGIDGYLFASA